MEDKSYSTVQIEEEEKQKSQQKIQPHIPSRPDRVISKIGKPKTLFIIMILYLFLLAGIYFFFIKQQKQQWVLYRQPFNRFYLGQQLGKFNSTVLNIDFKQDPDIQSYMYNFQDGSQILSKNFIRQKMPIINDELLERQLLNRISYEVMMFFSTNKESRQDQSRDMDLRVSKKFLNRNQKPNSQGNNNNAGQVNMNQEQTPICIFSEGTVDTPKQDLEKYFNSLQNISYTNFHVVYVNEFSSLILPNNAYNFLNESNLRIKNKIKIINNLQYMGTLANMYFWIKQFCGENDIVFIVGKDEIIQKQALQTLSSIYACQSNIWFSYSNFKSEISDQNLTKAQQNIKTIEFDKQSHIRSFRKRLIDSIPIQTLIDYKYDKNSKQAWPAFYYCSLRQLQDYIQFQNIAKFRGTKIDDILLQVPSTNNQLCHQERLKFYNIKKELRLPFEPISSLGEKARQVNDDKTNPRQSLNKLRDAYSELQNCMSKYKKKFFRKTVFNQNYLNTIFGKSQKTMVHLTDYMPTTKDVWHSFKNYETVSIEDPTYILTPTDLNKLIQKIDFWKYKEQIERQIPYEIIQFDQNLNSEQPLPKLQFKHFKKDEEIQKYMNNLFNIRGNNTLDYNEPHFQLGAKLFFNPSDPQALQAQLYYFNKRYNISQKQTQAPICLFTSERNIYKKNQYIQYFDSIQRLNYTNYHIIYIDDHSSDNSSEKIYDLVNSGKYPRIKNRMTLIHNLQGVGGLGNLFFWPQRLCKDNQIFVNIDADDAALGAQSFKVLSSAYQDQNTWYVHSRHLWVQNKKFARFGFVSRGLKEISLKTSEYRRSRVFISSHIRTFRLKLLKAVPIYQFIQFHYNVTTKLAWPSFHSLGYDTTQVYAQFELAGDDRVKYLLDFLYAWYGPSGGKKCSFIHEYYDHMKGTLKTPLEELKSLDQRGKQIKNDIIKQQFYDLPNQMDANMLKQGCLEQ